MALVGIEIARGTRRIADQEAAHRAELAALIARQQGLLAGEVSMLLGEAERHALFLARSPSVHRLLRDRSDPTRTALERGLLPHLASFRGIDRITVLDAEGVELARCERMGAGVAAIAPGLLATEPRTDLTDLAPGRRVGVVVSSALVEDAARVEVSADDRTVLHYVTPVVAYAPGAAEARGWIAVTAYAAPVLRALKGFAPLPGTWSVLLDRDGVVVAAPAADPDTWPAGIEAVRRAAAEIDPGAWVERDGAALTVTPLEGASGPAVRLASAVPVTALDEAAGLSAGERLRAASASLFMLLAIAIASAVFVRQEQRTARLREAQRYLRRLQDEARRYRALMEAAVDVLLVLSPADGRVRDWNASAGELFDLPDPARSGGAAVPIETVLARFSAEDREAIRAALDAALSSPETAVETPGLRLDAGESADPGESGTREVDLRCVALEYAGEALVEVALLDRTREREMERRVQTQDRLGSLGLFTAGVAHEINNPLEGIGNYLALLERGTADEERRSFLVRQVRSGLDRIKAIVGDLLRFARTAPDEGRADLAHAVERTLSMARFTEHLARVEVVLEGLDERLEVRGSSRRLEQVLLNLVLNAGRAMGGDGRLTIAARRPERDWVELSVDDEGDGIAEQDLPRLFDPFFTRGDGTGLGLAVSYGIVRTIGGEIHASNRPGGGARFVVRLPACPEDAGGGLEESKMRIRG